MIQASFLPKYFCPNLSAQNLFASFQRQVAVLNRRMAGSRTLPRDQIETSRQTALLAHGNRTPLRTLFWSHSCGGVRALDTVARVHFPLAQPEPADISRSRTGFARIRVHLESHVARFDSRVDCTRQRPDRDRFV